MTREGYERALLFRHAAEEFVVDEPLMIIACHKTIEEGRSPYDAVRYAWTLNVQKAQGRLVLASNHGVIAGAYRPDNQGWIPATVENFPATADRIQGGLVFMGPLRKARSGTSTLARLYPPNTYSRGLSAIATPSREGWCSRVYLPYPHSKWNRQRPLQAFCIGSGAIASSRGFCIKSTPGAPQGGSGLT